MNISPTDCVCEGGGRERGGEKEKERTSGLSQSVSFLVFFVCFFWGGTYFVSCNGPCAPKEILAQKRTHYYNNDT